MSSVLLLHADVVQAGIANTAQTYLLLQTVYLKKRDFHAAEQTLEEMKSVGIQPSTLHFTQLITGFSQNKDKEGIHRMLKKMQEVL